MMMIIITLPNQSTAPVMKINDKNTVVPGSGFLLHRCKLVVTLPLTLIAFRLAGAQFG